MALDLSTLTPQEQVASLFVGYFDRAPAPSGLNYWVGELTSGNMTITEIAASFGNQPETTGLYPLLGAPNLATQQGYLDLVTDIFNNLLGRDPANGLDNYYVQQLIGGADIGQVIVDIISGAQGADKALLENKIEVGLDWAAEALDNNIATSTNPLSEVVNGQLIILDEAAYNSARSVLDNVTDDPATVAAAKAETAAFMAASTYILTNDVDVASANVFNAQPAYTPGGTDFINTLQDEDVLTGTGDNPTLNAIIGTISEEGTESEIAPTLNGIETVNLRVTDNDVQRLDFQDATGLKNLNVNRITDTGTTLTLDNLAASTTSVSVSNATTDGEVHFLWREDELTATDNELDLTLDQARLGGNHSTFGLTIGETGDSAEDQGYGFETVNIQIDGSSNIDRMLVGANSEEDTETDTDQTINVFADAALEVNDLVADGAEFINLTANADVQIMADEDNLLDANNDGIQTADLQELTIIGAADVSIDGLDGDTSWNGTLGDTNNGDGVTVDASTMTGDLQLGADMLGDDESSVTSGFGDDEIIAYDGLAGDVATNAGEDYVGVDLYMYGTASIATGDDDDEVDAAGVDMQALADVEANANSSFGEALAASIDTGAGDDVVTAANLQGASDWNNGDLLDSNVDDTFFIVGASIVTGDGNDDVMFDTASEGAVINTGSDNDLVSVLFDGSTTVLAEDTLDTREVDLGGAQDFAGAHLMLGAGDDIAGFEEEDSTSGDAASTIVDTDAHLDGGAGADMMNVVALDVVNVTAINLGLLGDENGEAFNTYVDGVETLNLTVANQIIDDANLDVSENDDKDTDGQINVDVLRFDGDLATLNLVSEEQALEEFVLNSQEQYQAGTATKFVVNNLREDVAVSLSANEATGVNSGLLEDDSVTDVTLLVDLADASGNDDTFTLDVGAPNATYAGADNVDLNLEMGETSSFPAGKVADTDYMAENVVLNFASGSHAVDLNGFGDDDFANSDENVLTFLQWRNIDPINNQLESAYNAALAADLADGTNDGFVGQGVQIETSLTIANTEAGEAYTVVNVNADAIQITGGAAVDLTVDATNDYDVMTGTADDLVNMTADVVDDEDMIDLGAGRDTLVIAGNNSMGFDDTVQTENDEVWINKFGIEILEVDTDVTNPAANNKIAGSYYIVLDEEAFDTGIDTVNFTGMGDVDHTVVIGEDFDASSVTLDVAEDTGNVALILRNLQDTQVTLVDGLDMFADGGAAFLLDDEFDLAGVDLALKVANDEAPTTIINGDGNLTAADGTIELEVEDGTSGEFDSITLVDNYDQAAGADNGAITLTTADDWTKNDVMFVIDASAITNDDQDNGAGTDTPDDGIIGDDEYAASILTGGVTIDAKLETDSSLLIAGSENNDTITGGEQSDEISGGLGDDTIYGSATGAVIAGTPMVNTVTVAADTYNTGDEVTITVNGVGFTYTVSGGDVVADVTNGLIAALNNADVDTDADADIGASTTNAATGVITITGIDTSNGLNLGEEFTVSSSATNFPGVKEVTTVELADETYDAGDLVRITVDGVDYDYVVPADGTTRDTIATALAIDITTNSPTASAVASNGTVTVTADDVGDPMAVSSSVIDEDPVVQISETDITGLLLGSQLDVTINGDTYSAVFNVDATTTADNFATTYSAAILANHGVTVTDAAGVLTFTGAADGTSFTVSANGSVILPGDTTTPTVGDTVTDNTDASVGIVAGAEAAGADANTPPSVTDDVDGVAAVIADESAGDVLSGDVGNDTIYGYGGDDTIDGGDGDDNLFGGDGDDLIVTGTGNDSVDGGEGSDSIDLSGSTGTYDAGNGVFIGRDTIIYSTEAESQTVLGGGTGVDAVTGFNVGTLVTTGTDADGAGFDDTDEGDLIDLSGFVGAGLADGDGVAAGNQFNFTTALEAENALTGINNEVVFISSQNLLVVDTDGNGLIEESDFQVELSGVTSLFEDNFLL